MKPRSNAVYGIAENRNGSARNHQVLEFDIWLDGKSLTGRMAGTKPPVQKFHFDLRRCHCLQGYR